MRFCIGKSASIDRVPLLTVSSFAPDVLDYASVQPQLALRNWERVFAKAHELFGVPLLLDAADLLAGNVDEFSMLLYLSLFYQCVRKTKGVQ